MSLKPEYADVHALLRLGTKYQIDDLRLEAMSCLESLLPGDLQSWDSIAHSPPVNYVLADLLAMVNLTRELGLETLRARALYRCCQLPTNCLINGMVRSHGGLEQIGRAHV